MTSGLRITGSIRRRLTLQLVGSAAVLAVVLFLVVHNFARQVAEQSQDNILTASVTSILDSATIQGGEVSVDIPYAALSMLGNVSDDRVFYRIRAAGQLLTGYGDLPDSAQPENAQDRVFATATYKGDSVRMVTASRQLSLDGLPVEVQVSVAQTQNGRAETLARISKTAVLLGLGFFAISTVLALVAAQSSMRPLNRLAGAVSRRGPKDLRPVASPVPAEMAPLVSSLNNFIARLKTSLSRSEDFIAEAAHHVRTPLATVRAQAEVALSRVERVENRTALKEIIRAVDESSRAAGQLLDHAMVTFRTDHLERTQIDLGTLVAEAVNRLRPIADMKDIELTVSCDRQPQISGDAILLQSAFQNILDNAIKYSPRDRTIQVQVRQDGARALVRVLDQGPGFPERGAKALTKRFARGENAAATVGSGLGLTIANEVAEAHGGTLQIDNRPKGAGACVSLFFPL